MSFPMETRAGRSSVDGLPVLHALRQPVPQARAIYSEIYCWSRIGMPSRKGEAEKVALVCGRMYRSCLSLVAGKFLYGHQPECSSISQRELCTCDTVAKELKCIPAVDELHTSVYRHITHPVAAQGRQSRCLTLQYAIQFLSPT